MFAKWESAISDKERLVGQMSDMEARHKEQMTLQVQQKNVEIEDKIEDAVQKAKLEGKTKMEHWTCFVKYQKLFLYKRTAH